MVIFIHRHNVVESSDTPKGTKHTVFTVVNRGFFTQALEESKMGVGLKQIWLRNINLINWNRPRI